MTGVMRANNYADTTTNAQQKSKSSLRFFTLLLAELRNPIYGLVLLGSSGTLDVKADVRKIRLYDYNGRPETIICVGQPHATIAPELLRICRQT